MKKKVRNIKGFAMAELLAISIVILLIFSVLVSNYLPLVAEYENRTEYTNLTANYAAFYVRRIYKTVIDENYTGQVVGVLDAGLNNNGFYTIYQKGKRVDNNLLGFGRGGDSENRNSALNDIIENYGIEEIIITRYKLNVSDSSVKTAKRNYKPSSGSLYRYIQYLPNYNNAPHGSQKSNTYEAYRLIIKTKNFGYATTQILPDPPTPLACFAFDKNPSGLTIIGYNPNIEECKKYNEGYEKDVIVTGAKVTVPIISGGTATGFITEIGNDAFDGDSTRVKLNSIDLPNSVTTIGNNAFENNELKKFSFEKNAPGVTKVGNQAFRNNSLASITVPDGINYGKGVFSNNYLLESIEFDFVNDDENETHFIVESMFALDITDSATMDQRNAISITIPYTTKRIESNAFKNVMISEITFEGIESDDEKSLLTNIGELAFGAQCIEGTSCNNLQVDVPSLSITIPGSVTEIGEHAFENIPIYELVFEGTGLKEIGNYAFNIKKSLYEQMEEMETEEDTDEDEDEEKNLQIPSSVRTIGKYAFTNQLFNKIEFQNSSNELTIGEHAFENNSEKSLVINRNKVTIGKYAFAPAEGETGKLKTLTLTSKNLVIGEHAFESNKIKTLTLPSSGTTEIKDYAFYSNKKLKSLSITKAVTKIGNHSFDETGLSGTQSIPSSLPNYSIGTIAFGPKVTKIVVGNEGQITGFSWANVLNGGGQYGRAYKVYKCRHSYYCGCDCGCDKEGKNCKSCCYCSYTYTRNYCLDYDRTGDDKRVQSWNSTEGGCNDGDEKVTESEIKIGTPGMHCSK